MAKDKSFELTVIVVTYNAEQYIKACITSIVDNKQLSLQLIIIDGASTDRTIAIIKRFETDVDVLISEKDQGIYDAMNKALPYIKGKWVLFLGADDKLLPSFPAFAKQMKDDHTIYYGNCITQGEMRGGPFSNYKLAKMNICQQGVFYPSAVFDRYTYQLNYNVFADYALNLQCWGDASFKKQYLPVDVAYFNLTGFSSFASDAAFRKDKPALVKKYLGCWIYLRYRLKKWKESKKEDSQFF